MIERLVGLVAVLAIGSVVVPTEAPARGGGFGGGRAGGFAAGRVVSPGGFHQLGVRPFVPVRPVLPHAVHVPAHVRAVRFEPLRQRRQPFGRFHGDGSGFVVAGVNVFYGWPESVGDVPAPAQPSAPAAPGFAEPAPIYPGAVEPVPAFRHVCRSVPEMVPSEQGGAREITITRCYLTIE